MYEKMYTYFLDSLRGDLNGYADIIKGIVQRKLAKAESTSKEYELRKKTL